MIALMFLSAAAVYVVIGGLILKRISSRWLKGLVVAILILIPTGDEIAGHIYFNHLCSTEAGAKVYQTINLPAANWDAMGKPKFYDEKNGNSYPITGFNEGWKNYFEKNYSIDSHMENTSKILAIDKHIYTLQNKMKTKMFAQQVSFMYWGGWLKRNAPTHNTAASCGNTLADSNNFNLQLFKPVASIK